MGEDERNIGRLLVSWIVDLVDFMDLDKKYKFDDLRWLFKVIAFALFLSKYIWSILY